MLLSPHPPHPPQGTRAASWDMYAGDPKHGFCGLWGSPLQTVYIQVSLGVLHLQSPSPGDLLRDDVGVLG